MLDVTVRESSIQRIMPGSSILVTAQTITEFVSLQMAGPEGSESESHTFLISIDHMEKDHGVPAAALVMCKVRRT